MVDHEVAEIELGAQLHSFLGSLFTDLRRFDIAAEHMESASRIYQALGDDEGTARILMQLSTLRRYRGELNEALDADQEAIQLLAPRTSPRLYLSARFNYASNLALAGQPQRAREILVYDQDLYDEFADEHTRIRVTWLAGRISRATGALEEAEADFRSVRDHFVAQEHGFNCALVCLDLAFLYHCEARWLDLHDIASQAVRLFQAHALHQEALAALVLLRDAAAAERATAETIERVVTFLHSAQRDPKARFEASS